MSEDNGIIPVEDETIYIEEEGNKGPTMMGGVMDWLVNVINDVDEQGAAERVDQLREKYPEATNDVLADHLIKQKCLQTGAVGAVTSAPSLIPGLGTVTTWTFGVAADIGMTFKMQAELVLEIANVYDRTLRDEEKRTAVLVVTGFGAGTAKLAEKAGQEVAKQAAERLAKYSAAKAVPVFGVAASAGINLTSTYLMGHRAKAYFALPPDKRDQWDENVRALTGLDERKLVDWLAETTQSSWEMTKGTVQAVGLAVIGVGRVTGELAVTAVQRTSNTFISVKDRLFRRRRKEGEVLIIDHPSEVDEEARLSIWRRLWGATKPEDDEIEVVAVEDEAEGENGRYTFAFLRRQKKESETEPDTYELLDISTVEPARPNMYERLTDWWHGEPEPENVDAQSESHTNVVHIVKGWFGRDPEKPVVEDDTTNVTDNMEN